MVEVVEGVGGSAVEHALAYPVYSAPRGLNPDDLGAHVRQHHGAPWAEPDVGHVDDPYILEGFAHQVIHQAFYNVQGWVYKTFIRPPIRY